MDIFIQIINAFMPELTSIIICMAVAEAAYLYQVTVQRLPQSVRAHVQALAGTVVAAIEQKYNTGSPGRTIKKQEAMQMLLTVCQSLKIPLDTTHASAAIEAAVYELNMLAQTKTAQTPTIPMQVAPAPGAVVKKTLAAG